MKTKVLVAMSGGVDSSVAAVLLFKAGYDVIGVTISPFDVGIDESAEEKELRRKASVLDAENVCLSIGINHITCDLSELFRREVVDYFVNEYLSGRTPNPCIHCNPIIKWGELLNIADEIGATYLATGHYARISQDSETLNFYVQKGFDKSKDQSYFLWKLSSKQLSRTLFPLGAMQKTETRLKAKEIGLEVYEKADSQEVCFIRDNDYHNFLRKKVPNLSEMVPKGKIIFDGREVGEHNGFAYYTIGQRKGIGITHKEPLYVQRIDAKSNIIEIGTDDTLLKTDVTIQNINLTKRNSLDANILYDVKIRYKDKGTKAYCKNLQNGRMEIKFVEAVRAITPGQSITIYEGDDLLGGGIIE